MVPQDHGARLAMHQGRGGACGGAAGSLDGGRAMV